MKREQQISRTFGFYIFISVLFAITFLSFGSKSYAQSCLPTCSSVDGRFIAIAEGTGFETLTGGTLNVRLITSGTLSDFTIGIFDGDANVANINWDNGTVGGSLFTYTVIADPDRDGDGNVVFTTDSFSLPNNDWMDFTIVNDPTALRPDGNFGYTITIQHQEEVNNQNAFKLRSSGILEIDEPFQFLANIASLSDVQTVFPNFDNSNGVNQDDKIDANYDGSFTFTYVIPSEVGALTDITHWDGDADHGSPDINNPISDTDDPNTPNTIPDFSPDDAADTQNEGANGANPPDNTNPVLRRFGEAVTYTVTIPGVGTFNNDNPSGNREWEKFVISTTTDDPSIADAMASSIPLDATYIIEIVGLDMVNIMALNPPFPMRGETIGELPPIIMRNVPTLSEWGFISMMFGLGLISLFVIRRRNLARN